jgi:periplasmic divalent cation tolerance protein
MADLVQVIAQSDISSILLVITSVKNRKEARKMALVLVQRKLAACVQILGPMTSVFRWERKIKRTREYLCFIKTTKKRTEQVIREIQEIHSYETPEIIVVPIVGGQLDYLRWVEKECQGNDE